MIIVMTSSHQHDKWRETEGVLGTGDLAWLGGQRGLPGGGEPCLDDSMLSEPQTENQSLPPDSSFGTSELSQAGLEKGEDFQEEG